MSLTQSHNGVPHALLPDYGDIRLAKHRGAADLACLFDDEQAYAKALGDYLDDPQEIDKIVEHEVSHRQVAQQVGVEATRFAFVVGSNGGIHKMYLGMYGGCLPKLALAAIFAAPKDPSDIDIADIATLGYAGIEEVGDRIVDWNQVGTGYMITNKVMHC